MVRSRLSFSLPSALLALWTLGTALAPSPAWAQDYSVPDERQGVAAHVEPAIQLTRLAGDRGILAGATLTLQLGSSFRFGGGGYALLEPVSPPGEQDRSAAELTFGYGGLSLGLEAQTAHSRISWGGSILLGAGTARITSTVAETRLASANVLVATPRAHLRVAPLPFAYLGIGVGYRVTSSASSLPGVGAHALRGPEGSLLIRLTRSP